MSSLHYSVRAARPADRSAVLDIFYAALREHGFEAGPINLNAEVARFASREEPAQDDFVAVTGRKVVGFLILLPQTSGCGELAKVFVARAHRGRGVGTLLIAHCIDRARQRGYRRLVLETHAAFVGARRYYERHGWTPGPDLPIDVSTTRTYSLSLLDAAASTRRPPRVERPERPRRRRR